MLKESYTTFGVDIGLLKLLENAHGRRYIDIGCWKPDEYSNTYALYKCGWRGICIDPNTEFNNDWKEKRPHDTVLNCAVGPKGMAKYHMHDYSMANTLVPENLVERMGFKEEKVTDVELKPLTEIFQMSPPAHLLSIDVEGYEIPLLETNDWEKYRPQVIVIEDWDFDKAEKRKDLHPYLRSKRYHKLIDYYIDSVYVEHEFARFFFDPDKYD